MLVEHRFNCPTIHSWHALYIIIVFYNTFRSKAVPGRTIFRRLCCQKHFSVRKPLKTSNEGRPTLTPHTRSVWRKNVGKPQINERTIANDRLAAKVTARCWFRTAIYRLRLETRITSSSPSVPLTYRAKARLSAGEPITDRQPNKQKRSSVIRLWREVIKSCRPQSVVWKFTHCSYDPAKLCSRGDRAERFLSR